MDYDTMIVVILCGISSLLTYGEAVITCYGTYTDSWGRTKTKVYSCLSSQRCCGITCCSSTRYVTSSFAVYRMWYFWFCLAGGLVVLALMLGSYIRVRNRNRARVTNMGMVRRVGGQPATIVISQQQQQGQPRPMMAGYPIGHQPPPMHPPPPYTMHPGYPPGSAPMGQPGAQPPPPPPPPQPFAYGAQQATPQTAPPPAATTATGSEANSGSQTNAGQSQDGAAARPMAPAYGTIYSNPANFSKY